MNSVKTDILAPLWSLIVIWANGVVSRYRTRRARKQLAEVESGIAANRTELASLKEAEAHLHDLIGTLQAAENTAALVSDGVLQSIALKPRKHAKAQEQVLPTSEWKQHTGDSCPFSHFSQLVTVQRADDTYVTAFVAELSWRKGFSNSVVRYKAHALDAALLSSSENYSTVLPINKPRHG